MRRVIQKTRYDCGVATMAMVLGKTYKSIQKMRPKITKRHGISLGEMWMFLRDKGFNPKIVGYKPHGDANYAVNIKSRDGGGHWIALEGKTGKLYDPSPAPKLETFKEYKQRGWDFVAAIKIRKESV